MSYLEDPRVFLATERTLLAWIRTEISILAMAFLIKNFGLENGSHNHEKVNMIIYTLCAITIFLSILSFIQTWISLSKLGNIEIPGPLAKPFVLLSGVISILISIGATYIVVTL